MNIINNRQSVAGFTSSNKQ